MSVGKNTQRRERTEGDGGWADQHAVFNGVTWEGLWKRAAVMGEPWESGESIRQRELQAQGP